MPYGNKTLSGSILFVGAIIYILGTIAGEKVVGVFANVTLYNASVVLLGVLMLISVYFIQNAFKSIIFSASLALAGIGTIGIGLLTYASTEYYVFAGLGYVFFAISAILSYKYEKVKSFECHRQLYRQRARQFGRLKGVAMGMDIFIREFKFHSPAAASK